MYYLILGVSGSKCQNEEATLWLYFTWHIAEDEVEDLVDVLSYTVSSLDPLFSCL